MQSYLTNYFSTCVLLPKSGKTDSKNIIKMGNVNDWKLNGWEVKIVWKFFQWNNYNNKIVHYKLLWFILKGLIGIIVMFYR